MGEVLSGSGALQELNQSELKNQGNGVCFGTSMGLQAGQVAHASLADRRQELQRGVDMTLLSNSILTKNSTQFD